MQAPTSRLHRDVVQKSAPQKARKLRPPGSNSTSASSPNLIAKTTKDRSPKTADRRPRTTATEKRANTASASEPGTADLQEELKKTKEQLAAMSAQLEESQNQLKELSESEEARVQEWRKISKERDRAWQSELEAFQKQYSMDSAALASAMNEIQKLKMQLDRASQSEASQARHAECAHAEIQSLRIELTETLLLVEKLKNQLNESREYEARALEEVSKTQRQLQINSKEREKQPSQREAKLEVDSVLLQDLKASLVHKEALLQSITEENKKLKLEIMKAQTERSKANDAENEALTKLGSLTDEAGKSFMKVARVTEQLDAAEASNSEMEAELRRLKVQCDQWRKAAEAAAAMLSTSNNGKYGERLGSFDYHSLTKKLSSPDDDDDTDGDSPKKKNGNMLKKIGVLLKKGPK